MYSHITGVILAGGKSSRMGTNKSFLQLNGRTMIERIVDLMSPLFPSLLISTNSPEEYSFLSVKCIPDIYHHAGPLAGIHAALIHSETEKIFVLSCDMPLMSEDVIGFLIASSAHQPVTVATADGFVQQLCGVYDTSIIPVIETILRSNGTSNSSQPKKCSVLRLLDELSIKPVEFEQSYTGTNRKAFFNMNNMNDYHIIKSQHT